MTCAVLTISEDVRKGVVQVVFTRAVRLSWRSDAFQVVVAVVDGNDVDPLVS